MQAPRTLLSLAALLALPGVALATLPCEIERTHTLALDFENANRLQVSIGPDRLALEGAEDGDGILTIRLCASSPERLEALAFGQARLGTDGLQLTLDHGGRSNRYIRGWFAGRSDYGHFEISGRIPARLALELTVGSGGARVSDIAALDAVVGSGDLEVRRIAGPLRLTVGSGDVDAEHLGSLEITSIGSGDVEARRIGGEVSVGGIGSGDLELREVAGSVRIGTIGSGDAELRDIGGNVEIRTLGSGDVDVAGVGGDLSLRSKGSGRVRHSGVQGSVSLPNR